MRIAWHPDRDEFITAEAFGLEFGQRTTQRDVLFRRPLARCKVCGERVSLIATNPDRVAFFRHRPGIDCPTKTPAGRPYLALTPIEPDPASGNRLRVEFRRNWQSHYQELRQLIPYLAVDEFLHLIDLATRHRTWEYRGLQVDDIVFVFVLLADFPPWTGYPDGRREFWFRFWYEREVRQLEQLWIRPVGRAVLFRASFISPQSKRGRPAYDDVVKIVDCNQIRRKDLGPIPDYVVSTVENWFVRNRGYEFAEE